MSYYDSTGIRYLRNMFRFPFGGTEFNKIRLGLVSGNRFIWGKATVTISLSGLADRAKATIPYVVGLESNNLDEVEYI